jgi:hypothetical protein
MDIFFSMLAYLASWYSWFTDWSNPLSRRGREVFLRIIHTVEFRVALLVHQVRNLRTMTPHL